MNHRIFLFLEILNVIDYDVFFTRFFEKNIAKSLGICNDKCVFGYSINY